MMHLYRFIIESAFIPSELYVVNSGERKNKKNCARFPERTYSCIYIGLVMSSMHKRTSTAIENSSAPIHAMLSHFQKSKHHLAPHKFHDRISKAKEKVHTCLKIIRPEFVLRQTDLPCQGQQQSKPIDSHVIKHLKMLLQITTFVAGVNKLEADYVEPKSALKIYQHREEVLLKKLLLFRRRNFGTPPAA